MLRAALARYGRTVDLDTIALRLAGATGDPIVGVAAEFGLRLRELHPPAAAAGLDQSAEFPAHFHDSYAPLIRRALANGQTALAWKGWEDGAVWGLIERERDGVFEGPAGDGPAPVRLTGAAHQVYIVEAFEPHEADVRYDDAPPRAGDAHRRAARGGGRT